MPSKANAGDQLGQVNEMAASGMESRPGDVSDQ
jgi:hypothetical protein